MVMQGLYHQPNDAQGLGFRASRGFDFAAGLTAEHWQDFVDRPRGDDFAQPPVRASRNDCFGFEDSRAQFYVVLQ